MSRGHFRAIHKLQLCGYPHSVSGEAKLTYPFHPPFHMKLKLSASDVNMSVIRSTKAYILFAYASKLPVDACLASPKAMAPVFQFEVGGEVYMQRNGSFRSTELHHRPFCPHEAGIFGDSLNPDVPYKVLPLTLADTASKVVRMTLSRYGFTLLGHHAEEAGRQAVNPDDYCLVVVNIPPRGEKLP
ncbi:unnamed protein product [Protopolystoma xenopodis]|uniref:Ras-associating domain-containing protein n=1 Tax=Protopolystoma xenopodis TaxID=117903 RepID=A0A448WB71_9PLAT|nr:unnamed protein product [Protopolystoma xenopodis]